MLATQDELTDVQRELVAAPLDATIFLEGAAGTGKTSAAIARMLALMQAGAPGGKMLIWTPQRNLALPYQQAFNQPQSAAGGVPSVLTIGGLASRMIRLFWALVAEQAGFAEPDQAPTFLTMESAQYYMARIARPLLDEGMFASLTIDRNRLYSQILDNLNKAALVGFPYSEIAERLTSAWVGENRQLRIYHDAQTCANLFREYCLQHNLLDFSLQVQVFREQLWQLEICRNYLMEQYQYLIYDNPEEDAPAAHDIIRDWLPHFESALLVYDWQAGYRSFLGADASGAYALKAYCNQFFLFEDSFVNNSAISSLISHLGTALRPVVGSLTPGIDLPEAQREIKATPREAMQVKTQRFYPQMMDWVTERICELVHERGVPAGEIVVLAPYLSDSLRFALMERLKAREIPARSHRPSRALSEETATRCLLTLAKCAFPQWEFTPSRYDIAYAFMTAIEGLDLVRAQLLSGNVYSVKNKQPFLDSYDRLDSALRGRITYYVGERYEILRRWLVENAEAGAPFDHFLSRLFGELISQEGFGFHNNLDLGAMTANLIESVQKFRRAAGKQLEAEGVPLGKEYIRMVEEGVIAAQYLSRYEPDEGNAVLLAPAYTFLIRNQPRQIQFWLDVGSYGWSQRLYQPLTHPHVLSRNWEKGRLWKDEDEVMAGLVLLLRTVLGLLRRARRMVYLGVSELGEQGYEQRGPLLRAINRLLLEVRDSS